MLYRFYKHDNENYQHKESKMKISSKALSYFNQNPNRNMFDEPSFNEEYNKSHGLPSKEGYSFMRKVAKSKWGIGSLGKINKKDIENFFE